MSCELFSESTINAFMICKWLFNVFPVMCLNAGKPKIYLCDNEAKSRLIINSATEMPFLRTLVVGRGPPSRDLRNEAQSKGIQLLGMDDFMKLGAQKNHPLAVSAKWDNRLYLVMIST